MAAYSTADAARDLRAILDKAPKGAVSGEWIATTVQAGHSSCSGGYRDAEGGLTDDDGRAALDAIDDVVEKLEASAEQPFNSVTIRWTKSRIPFMAGKVGVETRFDASIVPRGPDDAIYDTVADIRRRYWATKGAVAAGYAAQRGELNIHGQTKWFSPHRRVLLVRQPGAVVLATDGLSTPWAGISEPENGVECEVMLELADDGLDDDRISLWADLLINLGDLVADGYRVARDVETNGAISFCRLTDDYRPMTRMILSRTTESIADMPFGPVPVIRATPITDAEIADHDPDEDWWAGAARRALERRGIAI